MFATVAFTAGPTWAAPVVEAQWNFEEPPGTTVATDATGNGHNAVLDARYPNVTFGTYDATVGSRVASMNMGLLLVPSTPALVPDNRNITVTVQIKTSDPSGFANFFQKGTYTRQGGFWKIEMSRDQARCRFIGDRGSVGFEAGPKINDGRWHTITCVKTSTQIALYVDGVLAKERNAAVGDITNADDIAIGGKYLKGGAPVSPEDMLHGDINFARYSLG